MVMDHSFSTCAKFSEKLTFLTPWSAHMGAYQEVRNVSFFINFAFAYVLNKWSLADFDSVDIRLTTEAFLGPCQVSMMKLFSENSFCK